MPRAERIEQESFERLRSKLSNRLEIKFWQDGTKSDCGVRLSRHDCWLPLQVKATADAHPPTNFNVYSGPYDMVMIVVWLQDDEGVMLLCPDDQKREFKTATWRVQDRVHKDSYWISWEHLPDVLERMIDGGMSTYTENELRSQLGHDDRKEFDHISLYRKHFPDAVCEWPPSVKILYDQISDGKREQFKTAFRRKNRTVLECPNFSHKIGGRKVPYELGDVDVFCFCAILKEKNVFLIWKIPANVLLPTTKTSLTLHVPLNLHQRLFDRLPNWHRDHVSLAPYLHVFELN